MDSGPYLSENLKSAKWGTSTNVSRNDADQSISRKNTKGEVCEKKRKQKREHGAGDCWKDILKTVEFDPNRTLNDGCGWFEAKQKVNVFWFTCCWTNATFLFYDTEF